MNKLRLAVLLFVIAVAVPKIAHANSYSLTITSFKADYYLSKDADNVPIMKVNEVIEASFPEGNVNHGILRALPTSYKGQPLDLKVESVSVVGQTSTPFSTSNSNGNKVLKIGSPSVYVNGPVTYRIVYTLKNPITFYDNHDELYWNVNGTQWDQPFDLVEGVVHIPANIAAANTPLPIVNGRRWVFTQACDFDQAASRCCWRSGEKHRVRSRFHHGGGDQDTLPSRAVSRWRMARKKCEMPERIPSQSGRCIVPPFLVFSNIYRSTQSIRQFTVPVNFSGGGS